ncbi:MAG: (2Fe-2S)-binding protein, partial [Quisquiliibacterium sp.]
PPSTLVDAQDRPIKASTIKPDEPMVFTYPFAATPAFLVALKQVPEPLPVKAGEKGEYLSLEGVGPNRNIVAYSAICTHRMMFPTAQISFINVRPGTGDEPSQVIHCCGDNSRYDPAKGARVLSAPAPAPLAMVKLQWRASDDSRHAVGVLGADMFKPFFEKYAFRLNMEMGRRARSACGDTTQTILATRYSRQRQFCAA